MDEFDQMKAQKDRILASSNNAIYEIALQALRNGAPGLSEPIRAGIARSIMLRVSALSNGERA